MKAPPDVFIALILIVIAVVAVVITNMGVLPKKSLPFILGGLAGIFGFAWFQKSRENALRDKLKRQEKELEALAARAKTTSASVEAADRQRTAAMADLLRQQEAARKELLLIRAQTAEEKEKIGRMHGDELFARFDEVFGGE